MRQGGYFPGKVTRVVDKFSNAWVKFPNEKKEHWWSVEVVLQWMPAGAAFAAMPAAFAAIATAAAAAAAKPTAVTAAAEPPTVETLAPAAANPGTAADLIPPMGPILRSWADAAVPDETIDTVVLEGIEIRSQRRSQRWADAATVEPATVETPHAAETVPPSPAETETPYDDDDLEGDIPLINLKPAGGAVITEV